ncbi:MAG: DUF4160 domain-containing protein [Gammaproteobacteria bacterium]|nr:DUF4160 domain-containing protein [Gammaproteobacteria bacterium]MCC5870299.1 DUF4160 domain-containing protein [Gammaproteobacteria bacterium]
MHVQRGPAEAKFWLNPVRLARSTGYSPSEVRRIRSMITTEQSLLMEAWNEFFSGKC